MRNTLKWTDDHITLHNIPWLSKSPQGNMEHPSCSLFLDYLDELPLRVTWKGENIGHKT